MLMEGSSPNIGRKNGSVATAVVPYYRLQGPFLKNRNLSVISYFPLPSS